MPKPSDQELITRYLRRPAQAGYWYRDENGQTHEGTWVGESADAADAIAQMRVWVPAQCDRPGAPMGELRITWGPRINR